MSCAPGDEKQVPGSRLEGDLAALLTDRHYHPALDDEQKLIAIVMTLPHVGRTLVGDPDHADVGVRISAAITSQYRWAMQPLDIRDT